MKGASIPDESPPDTVSSPEPMPEPPDLPGRMLDVTVQPVGPDTVTDCDGLLIEDQGPGGPPFTTRSPGRQRAGAIKRRRPRRMFLPFALFLATCVSTFWTASTGWEPFVSADAPGGDFRQAMIRNWDQGLIYMACAVAILLAHEMGHFLATVRYRIPASLPFFIPLPFTPLGTLGAVIGMDGKRANRRQLFDIGIAGPLAGLVVAVPILWAGVATTDLSRTADGLYAVDTPLLAHWLFAWLQPDQYTPDLVLTSSQLNPLYMAGWVGMLVTGLNMVPISQLDGGHVLYTLFGQRAHVLARLLVFVLIAYIVFWEASIWAPMLVLVILLGIDHPPTANDRVQLGLFRRLLGYASLSIPFLCLPPQGLWPRGM